MDGRNSLFHSPSCNSGFPIPWAKNSELSQSIYVSYSSLYISVKLAFFLSFRVLEMRSNEGLFLKM